jgi:hypothetical protein
MFFSSRGDLALASILLLVSSASAHAQEDSFQTRDIITGLYTPWELGRGRVTIVDALGRTVRAGEFEGGDRYRLLRGDFPAGVYQIEIGDGVRSVRLRALFR